MKLPNVLSTAVILAVAFFLEYLSGGIDQIVPSVWVPVAVLLLTGIAKALQVYAEQSGDAARATNDGGKFRRVLLG